MRVAHHDQQGLGPSDGHVEAFGVAQEAHGVTRIKPDQLFRRADL